MRVAVWAPGRVNLIGDHTDYTGGLVLPMAINRYTVVEGDSGGDRIHMVSVDEPSPVDLPLVVAEPHAVEPPWGRYVAGVVAELRPLQGFNGSVSTDIPIGAGLSSSAALEVGMALALGATGAPTEIAQLCRRAEHRASGVPCGIMDQLSISAGVAGHALMIDCHSLEITPVRVPEDLQIVVRFVAHRRLVGSPYADRVAECAAAELEVGPLRLASVGDLQRIGDPLVRARAQHVVHENRRVRSFAAALRADDRREAGRLMAEGHRSLAELYETSNAVMDETVGRMCAIPGVWGARMTGGGFGGCVVALTEPGAIEPDSTTWIVRPVDAAHRRQTL